MNKEYVMEKLARSFSALEEGILEPEVPGFDAAVGTLGGTIIGAPLGAYMAGGNFLRGNVRVTDPALRSQYLRKIMIRGGIKGAILGGAVLGMLSYMAAKEKNEAKEKAPVNYLRNLGTRLDDQF